MKHSSKWLDIRIFIAAAIIVLSASQISAVNSSFRITDFGESFTEMRFTLEDYELIPVEIDGVKYYRLFHPDAGIIAEEGSPELLSFSVMVAIPSTGQAYIDKPEILDTSRVENLLLFPSQGYNLEIDEDVGFLKDELFYEKDTTFGKQLIKTGPPAIMRDERLVNVTVNPFTYNPARNELTIVNDLRLTVNYDRSLPGENELTAYRPRSRAFDRIMRNSVINYGQYRNAGGTRQEFQVPHIVMIYHNTAAFEAVVNQMADWKRDKGYQVTVTSTAGMTSLMQIKNYLQNAYNNWENRPEYVILVGGFPEIPTQTNHMESGDHPYTLLDGNDLLPDIILGRIAASSQVQLATVWNKIRGYEREPFLGNTTWYNNTLLIGDRYASSLNMGKYVRDVMLNHSENKTFIEHYRTDGSASNFSAQINQGINQGVSYFMYRGYIGMSGWSPNDAALNNGYRLFHGTFVTCGTLNTGTSSHAVNSVNLGAPNAPKGAITAIGMFTGGTNSAQNNAITAAVFYGIFVEDLHTMGEAFVRAKLHLWNVYSNSGTAPMSNHLHWANLIGDPSVYVWREIPKNINAAYPRTLPKGSNSVNIVITDTDEEPLENVWVTIRQGNNDILATGYTDQDGVITHYFPSTSNGEIKVTATKFDYRPHLGTISINNENPAVSFEQIIAEDAFTAGQQAVFGLRIKNHRGQAVNGVNGVIRTESEYIDITGNSSGYGNIAAGATANSAANYTVVVSPDTPANYRAAIDLTVTDQADNNWLSRLVLPIQNGRLKLERIVVQDGNNGILEPGEQAQLRFHLMNDGQQDLSDISGRLSGGGRGFIISDSTGYFGDVNVGQTVTGTESFIEVSIGSYVIPGMMFDIELELYNDEGFSQIIREKIEIGIVTVADPLGPDEHGYWGFDEGDVDYIDVPEYDWIEIVPQLGGDGTNTNLQSDFNNVQQTRTMDLPFTFRFYGEEYDVISICANGWVSFKEMEEATQRNWRIPGPKVPMPVIAVFWDNLSLAQGGVFTWYDEENNLFVVQWQNALNIRNNAVETFQVILYDPMHHPTLTLDGPFKMQYKVFNNVNNSMGSPHGEWGNYATIGIADHTGKVGLEYTYNNRYPTAARPLTNESALYWTTGLSEIYVAVESFSFSDDNNNRPDFNETGHINMTLANIGIEEGEDVEAVLSSEDPYITVLQNWSQFGNIDAGMTSHINNAYTISIGDDVPHNHRALFNMTITAEGDNEWNDFFFLTINAPQITTKASMVYDPEPNGNNNGLIDPGERLTIYLPITNVGGAGSPPVSIEVSSNNDLAEILSVSETEFIGIEPQEILYPALTVQISEDAEPGDRLVFSYTVDTGNYQFEGQSVLGVGGLIPVQIGQGDLTSGGNAASPINIYFRSLRSQTVYTVEELEEAGMTRGLPMPITRFGYYVTQPPLHPLQDFVLRMKHTTADNVTQHDGGELTTVFSHDNYAPVADEWDMLTLSEPFEWNGVDNILVDTGFATVEGWSGSGRVRIVEQEHGFRFTRADSPSQIDQETTDTSSDKPQVLMMMGSDPEAAAHKPQNLDYELAGINVTLQWEAPPQRRSGRSTRNISARVSAGHDYRNPDGYNVYRNGRKINAELVEANEYNDSDFDPLPVNYYYVTAVYGDDETLPSNVVAVIAGRAEKPHISVEEGLYYQPFFVTLTSGTDDSQIYYTLDGSEPTIEDYLYDEPIEITWHTKVKARAFAEEYVASEIASAQYYVIYPPEDPEAEIRGRSVILTWQEPWLPQDGRSFDSPNSRSARGANDRQRQELNLRNVEGYNVYRKIGNEFVRQNDELIEVFRFSQLNLDTGIYEYFITAVHEEFGESGPSLPVVAYLGITAPPVFSVEPGEYDSPIQVELSSQTDGAEIYYTLDNTEPTQQSALYQNESIDIEVTTTIKAFAVFSDWQVSEVSSGHYIIHTSSTDEELLPIMETELFSAFPNPFNPQTTIGFALHQGGQTTLDIYNISGQRVKTIVNDYLSSGSYSYVWKGDNEQGHKVGSGIYFYRLTTDDFTAVRKVLMLK